MPSDGNFSAGEKRGVRLSSGRTMPRLRRALENSSPALVCLYYVCSALPLRSDLGLLILASATIPVAIFARPPCPIQVSPMDLAIFLFLSIQAVAVIFSSDPQASLFLSAPFVPAILAYYLISTHVRGARSLRLVCLAISIVAMGLASAVLWIAWRSPWTSTYRWASRLGSPMIVVPNDFSLLALAMPLSALFLARKCRGAERTAAAVSIGLSLAAITLLRSRVSLLTASISLTLFTALRRPRLVFISAAGLLVIFVATDAVFSFALLSKFGHIANDEGVTGRASLWAAAWAAFLDSPWKGQGPHTFVFAGVRWVHNLYLEALAEQGVAGLLALLILLGYGLWSAWRMYRSGSEETADLGGAAFAALAGFCFAAFFELTFLRQWVPLLLFTLLGVAARVAATRGDCVTMPV